MGKINLDKCRVFGSKRRTKDGIRYQKLVTIPVKSNIKIGDFVRIIPQTFEDRNFEAE